MRQNGSGPGGKCTNQSGPNNNAPCLYYFLARHNIQLKAEHIPGVHNIVPDSISRNFLQVFWQTGPTSQAGTYPNPSNLQAAAIHQTSGLAVARLEGIHFKQPSHKLTKSIHARPYKPRTVAGVAHLGNWQLWVPHSGFTSFESQFQTRESFRGQKPVDRCM